MVAVNGRGQPSSSLRYNTRRLLDAKLRGFSCTAGASVATHMFVEVGGGFSSTKFLIANHGPE